MQMNSQNGRVSWASKLTVCLYGHTGVDFHRLPVRESYLHQLA
jgi:hypothetical protein